MARDERPLPANSGLWPTGAKRGIGAVTSRYGPIRAHGVRILRKPLRDASGRAAGRTQEAERQKTQQYVIHVCSCARLPENKAACPIVPRRPHRPLGPHFLRGGKNPRRALQPGRAGRAPSLRPPVLSLFRPDKRLFGACSGPVKTPVRSPLESATAGLQSRQPIEIAGLSRSAHRHARQKAAC